MTPTPKKKKAYIAWTPEEIALLAQDAARRRLEDPLPALTSLVDKAQAAKLPADRRRALTSVLQSPALLAAIRAELAKLRPTETVEVPVVMAQPAEINASELAAMLTDAELIREGTERFIKTLAHRSAPLLANLAAIGTPPPPRALEIQPAERRGKRPLVAIIGPLKDQFEHIAAKCKDLALELAFIDKDKRGVPPATADWVIVQSRFVWHSQVKELQAVESLRGRIIQLDPSAGATGVCKALADLNAKLGMKKP